MSVVSPQALLDTIRSRRSIRRFEDRPVDSAVIFQLLEAARWAPSAHNRQPWRFAVITSAAQRDRLARAMGARFRSDLEADGLASAETNARVTRSYERISQAPALIVFFLSMADMDQCSDPRRQRLERNMAVQSVALSVQNMMLLAHAQGLGSCWICGPLFCPDVVRDTLDLPVDWEAQGLLAVGYPAERRDKTRHPVETMVRWY